MRRGGFEALIFLLFFGSHEADKFKKVRYFLPHNSASNFEALPRRNSEKLTTKFREAPRGRPKIRHQESSRGISRLLLWAPGTIVSPSARTY